MKTKMSISLSPEALELLKAAAAANGLNISQMAERAIRYATAVRCPVLEARPKRKKRTD